MYDEILVPCPKCGETLEFQTKGGWCTLKRIELDDVTLPELADVVGDECKCKKCGQIVGIGIDWAYEVIGIER